MQSHIRVTGERVIEEEYLRTRETYLIYLFHIATYRFAARHARGGHILDFGCGTGYGSALLAEHAAAVTGVDLSAEAIAYADAHYHRQNLTFRSIGRIEQNPLPFSDESFDTVVSFQVIEHIAETDAYLAEIARVLKPGGIFVVATPDRCTRLLPGQRPWNRYHIREYSAEDLQQSLVSRFKDIELYQMSGTPTVLAAELRRTRLLKWATLPFTFPGAPEWWRLRGLTLLSRLRRGKTPGRTQPHNEFDVSERDIHIGHDLRPSVNLIATARRR
jgi:2-polyprenyl-3-methyl-5-hydroxy-6-metoxy-1,4-benzoquinol methylase